MSEVSILQLPQDQLFEALRKSRLAQLIEDKGVLNRICEAAVHLLTDEKVKKCDEASILGALYKAATMGFRLEREYGECFLIPRNLKMKGPDGKDLKDEKGKDVWRSTCAFQIGYKGWKALALQSGHIRFLEAREVYKDDEFSFKHGTSAFLDHVPAEKNDGKMSHFYALCKLATGEPLFSVINIQQAEQSRKHSETQYREEGTYPNKVKIYEERPVGIWLKNYAPMALRVPIKKLCAMLPLTPAIERAMESDGVVTYAQKDGTVTTITPVDVEGMAEKPDETQMIDVEVLKDKILECWTAEALEVLYFSNPSHKTDYADLFTARKEELITMLKSGQIEKT